MERFQLKAQVREEIGKGAARKIRAKGMIPGVVYGFDQEPLPLSLVTRDLDRIMDKSESTNVLFDLEIEGKSTIGVMLREYQVHVIDRHFLHVDFQKIDPNKKIKVEVPIHLVGKAPGVKEGGIMEHIRRSLEVICLPDSMPSSIDVDVSGLNIGDTIHIHDLKLPEGIELVPMADVTVAAVVAPVAEEEVAPAEGEEAPTEPEVLTEKKADENGDKEKK